MNNILLNQSLIIQRVLKNSKSLADSLYRHSVVGLFGHSCSILDLRKDYAPTAAVADVVKVEKLENAMTRVVDRSEAPKPVMMAVSPNVQKVQDFQEVKVVQKVKDVKDVMELMDVKAAKDIGRQEAFDEIMECIDEEVDCQPLDKQGDTLNKYSPLSKILGNWFSKKRREIAEKNKRREEKLLNIPPAERMFLVTAEQGGTVQVTGSDIRNIYLNK